MAQEHDVNYVEMREPNQQTEFSFTRKCCTREVLAFDPDMQIVTYQSGPVTPCLSGCQNQRQQTVNIRDVSHVAVVQRTPLCYGSRQYVWCVFQLVVSVALIGAWIGLCWFFCDIDSFVPLWNTTANLTCDFPYDKFLFGGSGSASKPGWA